MNIIKFIEQFTNDGIIKSLSAPANRRESLSQFGKLGAGAALAAVPFTAFFTQKANASTKSFFTGTADTPISALQLALTLEYLEDEFYATALSTNGLIPVADQAIIAKISQHEAAHVNLLAGALGDDAVPMPEFDFTAGGAFDTFDNYQTFLAVAQAFEDTGVRAYKGQAANLMSNGGLLTTALQIHSVEARHASQIRRLRGLKGWITGDQRGAGMPAQTQAVYDGEQNTNQAGFNTANVMATNGPAIPAAAGSESFDEPITGSQATNIAMLFFAQ